MVYKLLAVVFLQCLWLLPAQAQEGGKVVLDLQEEPQQRDFLQLFEEYKKELDLFDVKYPGTQIRENFADDVAALHPDDTDKEVSTRESLLRMGVRGRRIFQQAQKMFQDFLLENDIPIQAADDEYATANAEKYRESDQPLVIQDFKKVITYANNERDRRAAADKAARDIGSLTRAEQLQMLRQIVANGDWKKLFTYGLYDGKPLLDEDGVGKWDNRETAAARLFSAYKTLDKDGKAVGALELLVSDGKFMLRRDFRDFSGVHVSFEKSDNLQEINVQWPLPERAYIRLKDSLTGYVGRVYVLFEAKAADASKPMVLRPEISADVCAGEVCDKAVLQPVLELSGMAAGKDLEPSRMEVPLRLIRRQMPQSETKGLRLLRLVVEETDEGEILRLAAESDETPANFKVYIEGKGAEEFYPPRTRIDGNRIVSRLIPKDRTTRLAGRRFDVTAAVAADKVVRRQMVAEEGIFADFMQEYTWPVILLMAFAGGLLLNVMPCVFPVLALKLLAITHFGGMNIERIRRHFAYNTAGIAAAFGLLILGLLGLKAAGRAVGWGMQFQSIGFLTLMIFVIGCFGAYVRGLFTLPPPDVFAKFINKQRTEAAAEFLSGLFLVLLSTPCTAPYLGTALGAALAGTPWQIAAVVGCVGAGLALPYILFALFPETAYFVPPPGKWLHWINALMQILLLATWLWLTALLAAQTNGAMWWHFGLYMLGLWLLLKLRQTSLQALDEQESDAVVYLKVRRVLNLIVAGLVLVLFAGAYFDASRAAREHRDMVVLQRTETFERGVIDRLLARGQTVLVKIGADWCLTCAYNDFAAFESPRVQEIIDKYNIVVLELDWTGYQEDVLRFMQKFGRSGLPFYVVFTPRIPEGMVLQEVLNDELLRQTLEKLQH